MISMAFVQILIARTSTDRIVEVFNEESKITNQKNPVMTVPDGSIQFKDVCALAMDDMNKLVLENINLDIKSGQVVGIIGGPGFKSALIPRLYDVTHGSILVGGQDVQEYDLKPCEIEFPWCCKAILFSVPLRRNLRWE